MKKITITLDEKTAEWARRHAAELNISLSRYVGELLERTMPRSSDYERAMRSYLARKPVKLGEVGECYPTRDQLHDRDTLR